MEAHSNRGSKRPSLHAEASFELGKVPPQALDLEEAVLGAAMLEREAVDVIAPLLQPEAFYRDAHRVIYEAILRLSKAGNPVDIYTVTQELRRIGKLEEIGGAQYLSKLTLKVGSAANVDYHAAVILEKYTRRKLIAVGHEIAALAFDEAEDIDSVVAKSNRSTDEVSEMFAGKLEAAPLSELVGQSVDGAYQRAESSKRGAITGVNTGLVDLNRSTNGWQNGDLIILAGRPAMGKTAMMLHFAKAAAKSGTPAAIFSLEMTGVQLTDRLVLSESEVNPDHFKSGFLSNDELNELGNAGSRVMKLPIHIDSASGVSMSQIRAKARVLHKQGKCGVVFIDYLQRCREKGDRGRSREQEVSAMSNEAKTIALELNIPVVLLSQLSREVEKRNNDKRPQLSDLRDSGGIEQDADAVSFVYRPAYYFKDAADESGNLYGNNYGELIFAKHRNGRTGTVSWRHNESLTKIFDDCDTQPPAANYYEPLGKIEEPF